MADFQEEKRDLVKTAFLYSQEGKWIKAIEAYERIVKMDPKDYNAINALGEMYAKRGLFVEAFNQFIAAAQGYEEQGNHPKTNNLFRKASRLDLSLGDRDIRKKQEVITRISYALDAMDNEEYEKVEKLFRDGLELFPQSTEILRRFADFLIKQERAAEAVKYLLEAIGIFLAEGRIELVAKIAQQILSLDPTNEQTIKIIGDLQSKGT